MTATNSDQSISVSSLCTTSSSTDIKDNEELSFIEAAKVKGANALLGRFIHKSNRFDRVLSGMTVERMGDGYVSCQLSVLEGIQNAYSTLHGGAISTLVDVVGTLGNDICP